MKTIMRAVLGVALIVLALTTNVSAQSRTAIESRFAVVNGVRLHYLVAGKGDPVLLLHGYAENSHMWRPLILELAKTHTVTAPSLFSQFLLYSASTWCTNDTEAPDASAMGRVHQNRGTRRCEELRVSRLLPRRRLNVASAITKLQRERRKCNQKNSQ